MRLALPDREHAGDAYSNRIDAAWIESEVLLFNMTLVRWHSRMLH
ncbi:MAG: hypothetical protein OJF61_002298 [Rhodanobacteraceae bacterium]|nr:MAG: hypothetical protein OJF61_002298 [Rhodanobacteraceae bacterium]